MGTVRSGKKYTFMDSYHRSKSLQTGRKTKPVMCLTNGKTYESIIDASKDTGVSQTTISRVMRGIIEHSKGFVFQEVKELEYKTNWS